MLEFDINILNFLNSQIGKSPAFDSAIIYLSQAHLFKATPLVLLLWGVWFTRSGDERARRRKVILTFFGTFVALAASRGLALLLPFRMRPLHNPELALQIPAGMDRGLLETWSSLPSDHAALAFALATGIFLINRRFGILALMHATLVICFPRAYLSLHYPTDLIAGAIVGISAVWITLRIANTDALIARVIAFEKLRPVVFYMLFFFITSQMAEMFDGTREFANGVLHIVKQSVQAGPTEN